MKKNKNLFIEKHKLCCTLLNYENELLKKNKIIHDFKNQSIVMRGLLNGNQTKSKNYLNEVINDIKSLDVNVLTELNKLSQGGLKELFYYKLAGLHEYKINLNIIISNDMCSIENLNIKLYGKLVKIIGIYLDNAFEAAVKTQNKIIQIEMYKRYKHYNFIISNSYEEDLILPKLGNTGYSTKGMHRGYGLSNIKDTLKNNKRIIETKYVDDGIYTVLLTIK